MGEGKEGEKEIDPGRRSGRGEVARERRKGGRDGDEKRRIRNKMKADFRGALE